MSEGKCCPKCGHDRYRIENFEGKAYCPRCSEAFNETRVKWLRESNAQLESTVARLRKALEYIADPIGAAQRKVKESNGELKLDSNMAIRLSESAYHLRDVARTALEETK